MEEYYTPPADHVFEEIKAAAIEIWTGYDDTHGYASSKIRIVESCQNIRDNAWYIVAMFDLINQERLLEKVSPETAELIRRARGR